MKRCLLGLFGAALVLAACGGEDAGGRTTVSTVAATSTTAATTTTVSDDDNETTTSTIGTTSTTAATTTTAAATTTTTASVTTTTAAATTTTTAPAGGSTVTIGAENFAFSPATVTISVGDTVQWVLNDGSHTTTSGTAPTPDGLWNQVISAEAPVSVTFDEAGQFDFYCRFHPDAMQGTVVVEP
jgi:plastocyanin